jgi:hypothetical protein
MQYYGMVEDDQWKYERMRKGNINSNNELKNNNLFRVVGYIYILNVNENMTVRPI